MTIFVLHTTKGALDIWSIFALLFLFTACETTSTGARQESRSFSVPRLMADSGYQVFVETPVGALETSIYNHHQKNIETLLPGNGGIRPDYLPYPLNTCFFPLWITEDSLVKIPAWLLAGRMEAGDTLAVKILGMIEYRESGIAKKELLVIPADPALQSVKVERFRDFIIVYDPVKFMFETWLKNRYGIGLLSQLSWQDEEKAGQYLQSLINQIGQ